MQFDPFFSSSLYKYHVDDFETASVAVHRAFWCWHTFIA